MMMMMQIRVLIDVMMGESIFSVAVTGSFLVADLHLAVATVTADRVIDQRAAMAVGPL